MELMIGIAIIAIVAVIASPALLEWNANRRLMKHARDLYSHMQQAKLEAIRNNCDVVVSFNAPTSYQVFLDNGGPTGTGLAGDEVRSGDEIIITSITIIGDVSMLIDAAQFAGTTTPGFTSRGLPLQGRIGNVVFRRNGQAHRWYRVDLSPSGQLDLQVSSDSTDGVDGHWN